MHHLFRSVCILVLSTTGIAALTADIKVEPGSVVSVGEEVFFDATGTTDDVSLDNAVFTWNFGDHAVPEPAGITSVHHYMRPGTYTARILVVDADSSEIDSASATITITGSWLKLPPRPAISPVLALAFENSLADSSGNGFDASGSAAYADGAEGRALDLSGGAFICVSGFSGLDGTDAFTVSFRARKLSSDADGYYVYVPGVCYLRMNANGDQMVGSVTTVNGEARAVYWYAGAKNTRWHHYALVYDGSSVRLFFDGRELVQEGRCPAAQTGMTGSADGDAYIGTSSGTGTVASVLVDELRIFTVALTGDEISTGLEMRHADFHGHIRQYVYVQVPGAVRADPANRLTVILSDGAGYTDVLVDKNGLEPEERFMLVQETLPAGTYTLTARLLDAGGAVLDGITESFAKLYDGIPYCGMDENNAVVVDGEPFYPVTPFGCNNADVVTWGREGYINCLHSQGFWPSDRYTVAGWGEYLDLGAAAGITAMGPGNWGQPANDRNADINVLESYVNAYKDNATQLMWQWGDEPDLGSDDICLPPTVLRSQTYQSHALDPQRPVTTTYVGNYYRYDDDWGAGHRRQYVYRYNAGTFGRKTMTADALAFDYYPIEWAAPSGRNATMAELVTIIERLRSDTYDMVPVFSAVETGDIREYEWGTTTYPTPWPPSPEQLRMIVWTNVVHGVKGILWFPWHGGTPAVNYPVMSGFVDRVTRLAPVILGPESGRTVTVTASGDARIDYMVREHGDDLYVFAVRVSETDSSGNPEGETQTATVTLPGDVTAPCAVVFDENRLVDINAGSFIDTFDVCAVHIYRIATGDSVLVDMDGDGYFGDRSVPQPALVDCDDADPQVHPGATELCDGRDNDCNGVTDDGFPSGDDDNDGYVYCTDNCPADSNPAQGDFDADGLGDACDSVYTYFEDFSLRDAGTADLDSHRAVNDFTWHRAAGGGGVSNDNDKALMSDCIAADTRIITDQVFGRFTLSYELGVGWGNAEDTEDGLFLLYQDARNFYYLTHGHDGSGLLSGAPEYAYGALYRVTDGSAVLIGNEGGLNVDHTYTYDMNRYSVTVSNSSGELRVSVTREKLYGDSSVVSYAFTDTAPPYARGAFGFYHRYQQYNHLYVDDIRLDTDERPDSAWYHPSSVRDGNPLPGRTGMDISIVPNPVVSDMLITGSRTFERARIYTMQGVPAADLKLECGNMLRIGQTLPGGMYLLELDGVLTRKIIVAGPRND